MTQRICGLPCEVYSRVVGYIRPVQQWNAGKKSEYADRVTFSVGDDRPRDTRPLRKRYSQEQLIGWGF